MATKKSADYALLKLSTAMESWRQLTPTLIKPHIKSKISLKATGNSPAITKCI